ncbi:MAG: sulfur carrier protein ThiS [Bacteroidales bacterium]|nr:sulfur carrier protein ThiS [Bacteroidales bacterium]
MTIIVNDRQLSLPGDIHSLKDFTEWKSIPNQGTAIALNGKLVKAENWAATALSEFDNLLIISAAYGG